MNKLNRLGLPVACLLFAVTNVCAQDAPRFKDEMRQPWQRGNTDFIRQWLTIGPFQCTLETECLGAGIAESAAQPTEGLELKRADGSAVKWHGFKAWGDGVGFEDFEGSREGTIGFAFTKITRASAGKAMLSAGSSAGMRLWVNGKPVLSRTGDRSLVADEDQREIELRQGENSVLVKAPADSFFKLRVLEAGSRLLREPEIGPSMAGMMPAAFSINTDINARNADADPVTVEVIAPGGTVMSKVTAPRGEQVFIDGKVWPDGPYDVRCSTRDTQGRLAVTHLEWYKGDALAKARDLAAEAAKADASKPEGFTLRMLANMVEDRLGGKLADAKGNPWPKIHSPLMEFDELMRERAGKPGRVRPFGFVRLAWTDEVDGSPQYARAYLPANYDPAKKWPLVISLHGYNPANPVYWRWWSADERHALDGMRSEQGFIYIDAHGRGNVQYLGFADSDVLRGIAEARRAFSVDDDRVYLAGESMGGWGTWNVSTRHPEVFAAIGPVFGGVDYHAQMSEEELAALTPTARFANEKQSSWSMAESLVNTPIYVHHGDDDKAVNVDWSRWGVKMLQRWGYDVRYHEYPGKGHEALGFGTAALSLDWFLKHRRDPAPRKVRIRSAELRNAAAWWARVEQSASPLAFMLVDAEVVDRNVIRLDTENVLDVVLTPPAAIVDPAKPVSVVWNGVARELRMANGALRLTHENYKPAALHKTPKLPGSATDFLMTPFAVVVGTSSRDPDMVALCKTKAESFVASWFEWQKVKPRVFLDSEIGAADIARYSLMLIGGPEANRVSARLASKLPLRISANGVRIDGQQFDARDAAVQMLYPNPMNAERYVWIFAGTSTDGMYLAEPNPQRIPDWDYVIVDGYIPGHKQSAAPEQLRVASGAFDYNWRFSNALSHRGDAAVRAKGRQIKRPRPGLVIDPKVLATYVGRYQVDGGGPLVQVKIDDGKLVALAGASIAMEPESESVFYVPSMNMRVFFERDAAGKVWGFTGTDGRDFEAKKLD